MADTLWHVEQPKGIAGSREYQHHPAYSWHRIVDGDGSTVGFSPDMPTATLFAAASGLLKALEALAYDVRAMDEDYDIRPSFVAAREAIAKATNT